MNLTDYWLTSQYNKRNDYLVNKMQKESVDIKGNHNHSKSLGIFLSSAYLYCCSKQLTQGKYLVNQ